MSRFSIGVNIIVRPYLVVAILLHVGHTWEANVATAVKMPDSNGVSNIVFANM